MSTDNPTSQHDRDGDEYQQQAAVIHDIIDQLDVIQQTTDIDVIDRAIMDQKPSLETIADALEHYSSQDGALDDHELYEWMLSRHHGRTHHR